MGWSFVNVLNLSISASWLVLAVAVLRFVLKKAPKWFHCALWALVAVRLICPISIESEMSLIPSRQVVPETYLSMEPVENDAPAKLGIVTNPVYQTEVEIDTDTTLDRVQTWDVFATLIWLTGMGAMGIYALFSYLSLRLRVRMAAHLRERVWVCDDIDSPFILGILRPRIYLPSALDEGTAGHVLAHEMAHLKRLDHLWKPLGFVLLTIHWFNPVMWLAYCLLCRDIELACDEKVIRSLDKPGVRRYSEALVACAVSHRMIAACPLAFGEVGVKSRVKSMLNYKKPGFWVLVTAAVLSVLLAACFMTDPASPEPDLDRIRQEDGFTITSQTEESVHVMLYKSWLPETVLDGSEYTFGENDIVTYDSDGTRMYLSAARMYGDELRLTFQFEYTLDDGGRILLPYQVENGGRAWTADVQDEFAHDFTTDYPGAARLIQYGPDQSIALGIKMDVYESADDYIAFDISGLNELCYVADGSAMADMVGKTYQVAEIVYASETMDLGYTVQNTPVYTVGTDLCMSCRVRSPIWELNGNLGDLIPVELTWDNFYEQLFPEGWTGENLKSRLRSRTETAWMSTEPYGVPARTHVLLPQKDGSVYLAVLLEEGDGIANVYRLEETLWLPDDGVTFAQNYSLHGADPLFGPWFELLSDGTFSFVESPLSSYWGHGVYTLTETELVMRTNDGLYTWYFTRDGENFVYDAERSDSIQYWLERDMLQLQTGALFVPEGGGTLSAEEQTLETAIRDAIIGENQADYPDSVIQTAAYILLDQQELCIDASDGGSVLLKLYLHTMYQQFDVVETTVTDSGGCVVPAVLTFDVTNGQYTLTDYWTPRDGALYSDDLKANLTETALELLIGNAPEYNRLLGEECASQADLWLEANKSPDQEMEMLLEEICSYPAWSSAPGPYIDTHPEEYARILELGDSALRYCFEQFAQGQQLGLPGHIMAIACQEIITNSGEECAVEEGYMTGQAWFNQYAEHAEELLGDLGEEMLRKYHPACALALDILEIRPEPI